MSERRRHRYCGLLIATLLAACGGAVEVNAQFEFPGRTPARSPRAVDVELLADTTFISPGQTFEVVVVFNIRDEWRIFWLNSGDEGRQTIVTFTAPEGYHIGEPRYTAPERFEVGGADEDRVSYGYTGRAAVFVEITPPVALEPGAEVEIEADARWLAKQGIEGFAQREQLQMTLMVASPDAEPEPDNLAVLRPLRERLPAPLNDSDEIDLTWRPPGMRPTLTIEVFDADALEFYPYPPTAGTRLVGVERLDRENRTASIRLTYECDLRSATGRAFAHGVLMVRRGGDDQKWFEVRSTYRTAFER